MTIEGLSIVKVLHGCRGNMCAPSRKDSIRYVKEAWAFITREATMRSFQTAAITIAADGSENRLISV